MRIIKRLLCLLGIHQMVDAECHWVMSHVTLKLGISYCSVCLRVDEDVADQIRENTRRTGIRPVAVIKNKTAFYV